MPASFYIQYLSKEQHWNYKFGDSVNNQKPANTQIKVLCVSVDWPLWHVNRKPAEVIMDYMLYYMLCS